MEDSVKVLYDSGKNYVTLTHRASDPLSWIMTVYKKGLFKKKIKSIWFTGEADAMRYSDEIIKSLSLSA